MRWISVFVAAWLCLIAVAPAVSKNNACYGDVSEIAITACSAILKKIPGDVGARLNRAIAYIKVRSDYDRAMSDSKIVIRSEPLPPQARVVAHRTMGYAYLCKGQFQLAIAELDQSNRDGKNPMSLFALGVAKFKAGDAASGRADMNAAATIVPGLPKDWNDGWPNCPNAIVPVPE